MFLKKKINFFLLIIISYLFSINYSHSNSQQELINKYKSINTMYFNFTQKIGDKIEIGNCYIKYSLFMNCEYPKKKKNIITNGKKLAVVKRRYKKIYHYPLRKTPLFYLLNKENILNLLENNKPKSINSNIIEYKLIDSNSNEINIFFEKNQLHLVGWKTIDAYSNEVSFVIKNVKINIPIKDKIFRIPKEEDL